MSAPVRSADDMARAALLLSALQMADARLGAGHDLTALSQVAHRACRALRDMGVPVNMRDAYSQAAAAVLDWMGVER